MRGDIIGILTVAGGYAAAVIGAGFASGQEIVSFFVRQGRAGIIGIAVACTIFSLFAYTVLSRCITSGTHSFSALLAEIIPGKTMRRAVEAVILLCAMSTLCVMTSCAGELGAQLYGAPVIMGAAAFSVVCGMVFLMEIRGMMSTNAALGAVIITGIIFSCLYILRYREHQTLAPQVKAVVSGLSYAGYNVVGTGAVLAAMSRFLTEKKDAAIAAVSSGIILFTMTALIWTVLSIYYGKINLGEIPMLTMTFRQGKTLGIFYGALLAAAVITTGISSGYAVIDMLSRRMNPKNAANITLLVSFCMSGAGFSTLIDTLYRLCGYMGIAAAVYIGLKCRTRIKNEEKSRKPKHLPQNTPINGNNS